MLAESLRGEVPGYTPHDDERAVSPQRLSLAHYALVLPVELEETRLYPAEIRPSLGARNELHPRRRPDLEMPQHRVPGRREIVRIVVQLDALDLSRAIYEGGRDLLETLAAAPWNPAHREPLDCREIGQARRCVACESPAPAGLVPLLTPCEQRSSDANWVHRQRAVVETRLHRRSVRLLQTGPVGDQGFARTGRHRRQPELALENPEETGGTENHVIDRTLRQPGPEAIEGETEANDHRIPSESLRPR